jgi:serine protease Do
MMRGYRRNILITVLAVGMLSAAWFACTGDAAKNALGIATAISPLKDDPEVVKLSEMQGVFRKIYKLYEDRIVFISTEQTVRIPYHPLYDFFNVPREQKRTGLGSGFIISEEGYICTNFHVVAPEGVVVDKITVIVEDRTYPAEVRGYDEHRDIAILKIEPKHKLKAAFFGNSDEVAVGDWAIAIGNPFGLSKSFTVGNISAVGRTNIDEDGESYIQTDAAINPGNSGGPLINIRGEVIGINRMIFSKSGGYQGIGFAIPINSVRDNFDALIRQKSFQKGFIGLMLRPLTQEVASFHRWREGYGAVVENVLPGGAAQEAGLMRGDIIIGVNGTKVKSVNVLIREIEKAGAGKRIELDVFRRGSKMKFYLTTRIKTQN